MVEFLFGLTLGVLIVITMSAAGIITYNKSNEGDKHD